MKKHFLISSPVALLLLCLGPLLALFSSCDKPPANTPCDPPTNLQVTGIGPTTATLTWSAPPNTTVEIVVSPDPVPGGPFTTSDTTFTLTGLSPNTDYKVTLRTLCGDGFYSLPVMATFKTTNIIIVDVVVQREVDISDGLALCGGTNDKMDEPAIIPWDNALFTREMIEMVSGNTVVYLLKKQDTSGGFRYYCFGNGISFCGSTTNNVPTSIQTTTTGVRLVGNGYSIDLNGSEATMNPNGGGSTVYSMYR